MQVNTFPPSYPAKRIILLDLCFLYTNTATITMVASIKIAITTPAIARISTEVDDFASTCFTGVVGCSQLILQLNSVKYTKQFATTVSWIPPATSVGLVHTHC